MPYAKQVYDFFCLSQQKHRLEMTSKKKNKSRLQRIHKSDNWFRKLIREKGLTVLQNAIEERLEKSNNITWT